MIENSKQQLTLDRPARYQIKVPGQLNASWSEWVEGLSVTVENDADGLPVTILSGKFDQSALQGLLRRLYSMGLPLISVTHTGGTRADHVQSSIPNDSS